MFFLYYVLHVDDATVEMTTLMLRIMATSGRWVPCCDISAHKASIQPVCAIEIVYIILHLGLFKFVVIVSYYVSVTFETINADKRNLIHAFRLWIDPVSIQLL